jgi:hypothetical protein
MTTAGPDSPYTALDLLFDQAADAAGTLAGEILSPGGDQSLSRALADFPEAIRNIAVREAAAKAVAALQKVDLIGVLVSGWREHADIVSAARRTLAEPASTELVSMSEHEVKLEQRPYVSVLVNGRPVATLRLGLSVVFDVTALLLVIARGRLTAVRAGRCDITASLTVQDTDLLVKQAPLELPGVMTLARGIRLLPASEYPARDDPPDERALGSPGRPAS